MEFSCWSLLICPCDMVWLEVKTMCRSLLLSYWQSKVFWVLRAVTRGGVVLSL